MQDTVVMGKYGVPISSILTAVYHGGAPLPALVKLAMRFAADVMRQTASRI